MFLRFSIIINFSITIITIMSIPLVIIHNFKLINSMFVCSIEWAAPPRRRNNIIYKLI